MKKQREGVHSIYPQIRKRKAEKINYLTQLSLNYSEYLDLKQEYLTLIEEFSEEHIIHLKMMNLKKNLLINIIEMFCYITNINYVNVDVFKEMINLEVLKEKIRNVSYENFDFLKINLFLVKLSKKKEFSQEFIDFNYPGFSLFYRFIRVLLRIYIYYYHNLRKKVEKEKTKESEKVNEKDFNNFILRNTLSSSNHDTYETMMKMNTYITNVESNIVKKRVNQSIKVKKQVKIPEISSTQVKLDYIKDAKIHPYKQIQNLPLITHKTFQQLRAYYNDASTEKEVVNEKHFNDLYDISLLNPNNNKRILYLISNGKFKSLSPDIISNFIDN